MPATPTVDLFSISPCLDILEKVQYSHFEDIGYTLLVTWPISVLTSWSAFLCTVCLKRSGNLGISQQVFYSIECTRICGQQLFCPVRAHQRSSELPKRVSAQ